MKRLLKRIYIILFTKRPYRVRPFAEIYKPQPGSPVDQPEARPMVLLQQQGQTIIYPSEPKCLNGEIKHRYLNNRLRYLPSGIFREADRYVYSIPNGSVIGPLGLVYDVEKRVFIDESAKEWTINLKDSPYTNLVNYPAKEYLKGITVSCLTISADGGFYHFLLEAMVKLHLYDEMLKSADHILFNGPETGWKLKWLQRANVDINKVTWVSNTSHYECEQMLFTNRLINDQQISNWCIGGLKQLFNVKDDIAPRGPGKMIWISRKGRGLRELTWENNFLTQFPEITSVDLNMLTAEETIAIFQKATHVISAHGAGLTNIYLCQPGTKVLEIYPTDGTTYQPCYQRISALCKLDYALMYLNFSDIDDVTYGINAFAREYDQFKC